MAAANEQRVSKSVNATPKDASLNIIEAELPSLQDLQQQVLNTRTNRTRTLIMYAVAIAVLIGLSKKIIIPPFNTTVDIDTGKFAIVAVIIISAAFYLIWELWNGVGDSIRSWLLNRDLAFQHFRHACLNGISELEDRVTSKLQDSIERNAGKIRAVLTEEKNEIQTRLSQVLSRRQELEQESNRIATELLRIRQREEALSSGMHSVDSDTRLAGAPLDDSSSNDSATRFSGQYSSLAAEQDRIRDNIVQLNQQEPELISERMSIERRLKAGETIKEVARNEAIKELDSFFTDSVNELVKEWRSRQLQKDGAAKRYSLMLGVERKNNDFRKLQTEESKIIRYKAHNPKWISTLMLIAALIIPVWTLGQDVYCETYTTREECPDESEYRMKNAIDDIGEKMDLIASNVLQTTSQMHGQRTTVLSTLLNASQRQPQQVIVNTNSGSSQPTRPIYAGGDTRGLLRLSFPVFPRNEDTVLESESAWLSASARSLIKALDTCGENAWLHVVAYADSALYREPYPACTELPEGGSLDMERSRNLCLANRRARSVAGIFSSVVKESSSTAKITARQWQGVTCSAADCYSEYEMMLHQAGIVDKNGENEGVLNRRADVHIMSAGSCDLQTVVSRL